MYLGLEYVISIASPAFERGHYAVLHNRPSVCLSRRFGHCRQSPPRLGREWGYRPPPSPAPDADECGPKRSVYVIFAPRHQSHYYSVKRFVLVLLFGGAVILCLVT